MAGNYANAPESDFQFERSNIFILIRCSNVSHTVCFCFVLFVFRGLSFCRFNSFLVCMFTNLTHTHANAHTRTTAAKIFY